MSLTGTPAIESATGATAELFTRKAAAKVPTPSRPRLFANCGGGQDPCSRNTKAQQSRAFRHDPVNGSQNR